MSKKTTPTADRLSGQLIKERRRVDYDSYDITVQQLVTMVSDSQIDVAPIYQRRFRWEPARQSTLIESILLGIPIPNLFMATNKNGSWEVVDGVQRLSTIVQFAGDAGARQAICERTSSKNAAAPPLRLEGLEKLTYFNGYRFDRLPPAIQTQFKLRPIKITTLNDKSDKKVRFDLFERLNTGGVALTAQEIRGCIFRGRFNDFLEEMSVSADFRKVAIFKESARKDGTPEEFVLRFFAFLNGYKSFDHSVVNFLNDYMESASISFDYERGRKEFNSTFAQLAKALPHGVHRKTRLTPVNLYESIAVGAGLALRRKKVINAKGLQAWMKSAELKALTTGATNNKSMVLGRIEFAAKKFMT